MSKRERSRRRLATGGRAATVQAVVCLLGVGLLGSCRSVEGTRGLPPFFEVYDSPSTIGAREGSETYWRPFGSHERYEPESSRVRVIFPFVDVHEEPNLSTYQVLPVFRYRSRLEEPGGRNVDWMLFPFLFYGSHPEHGSYFAFFPFGGKLRGLLAQDEIDFVLFPLYWHMRDQRRHSIHALWPFFNTVRGDGWAGGRFWPFYGSYTWRTEDGTLRSRRRTILWPFYISQEEQLASNPTRIFFTFPFYGIRENRLSLTETYVWPLYVTHRSKKRGSELTGGYFFPYRFSAGEPFTHQFDVWPFYGRKVLEPDPTSRLRRERYRQYCLWPIQRYDWARDELVESSRLWILPLFWRFYTIERATLDEELEWKLWPLCRYIDGKEFGEPVVKFDLLSPLWFRRTDYDRTYNRLFAVFRYRWTAARRGWELLYGTLAWIREGETASFSVLGGALELASTAEGFSMRILYIPWWD